MQIEKILMVDDDPSIRMVAEISLIKVGKWKVALAESGKAALEAAAKERPDLILLDVMMPGMDGPTVLRKLRENSDTPVIFMTAKIQNNEVDKYLKLGAIGVISKPFDPMTLPGDIRNILAGICQSSIFSGLQIPVTASRPIGEECHR